MKNTLKMASCLFALIFLISGCKKDSSIESSSSSKKIEKIASNQNSESTSCEEEYAVEMSTMAAFTNSPDGLNTELSPSGTVDFYVSVADWVVARQNSGAWLITSHESIAYVRNVPANPDKPFKMTDVNHDGSTLTTGLPLPMSWTEGSSSKYVSAFVSSVRVTGNVYFCGVTIGSIDAYQIFTI